MRVFISGVAGFLGSHLADAWLARGAVVAGCDSLIGGYRDNVPIGVVFCECDCNDLDRVRQAMGSADVVYHCAATAYEGLSVFSPHLVTQSGVSATAAMVAAACSNRVRRVIFLSSMARYGSQRVPFVETMPACPQDPYGIGKVAAEQLVSNLCDVHGVEWTIAVPHNIYGPRQKYDDPYRNVAAIFANMMLQGRQPFIYGDGAQRRCFSHADDCVEPLVRMATAPQVKGEIVNIGPDDTEEFVSVLDLARLLAEIIKFDLAPVFVQDRPQEVRLASCSAAKARKLLGYAPKMPLYMGLEQLVSWIRYRGPRLFKYHLPLEIVTDKTPETWARRLF